MIVILTKEDKITQRGSNSINNFHLPSEFLHRAELILYFDDFNPRGLVIKDRNGQDGNGYLPRT